MSLKLYVHPLSQPARALLLFCRANSIPFQEQFVDLVKGDHKTEEYKNKVNPFQKIPVIDHDGFRLTESVAILRYLSRTFPVSDHWYPKDSKLQARVDAYMAWQHLNLRSFGSMYFVTGYIVPMSTKQPPNETKLLKFKNGLDKCLTEISDIWLKEGPFIAGKEISVADLLAVCEMEQPGMAGYDVKTFNTKISDYMGLVREVLQPHYDEVHGKCHAVQKKTKEFMSRAKAA